MSVRTERLSTHRFRSSDRVLFDTNIWLYIENPGAADDQLTVIYSKALKNILHAGTRIYIHEIILSELVNVLTHQAFRRADLDRKKWDLRKFRKSAIFRPEAENIARLTRRIMERCEIAHVKISKQWFVNILDRFKLGYSDINDLLIAEVCRVGGFTLVTHDVDFRAQRLRILTENKKLLR